MKVAGIIVEYNPMHNGHCYHIQQTRKLTGADAVVAVMSGDFLQRGEPAILSKWSRTEMALRNGVDLVLELPVVYSVQSARLFAYGSVATLDALGITDVLCFGSERGDINSLLQLSAIIADPPVLMQTELQKQLESGLSYPAAYSEALRIYAVSRNDLDAHVLDLPNNMLGLEYLRALHTLNSRIKPFTVQRIAAGYNEPSFTHSEIASATAIRNAISEGVPMDAYLPPVNLEILQQEFNQGRGPVSWNSYTQLLFGLLARSTPEELRDYMHFDEEGLAERIWEAVNHSGSVSELIYTVKTRRYTWTRIQRALASLLLGFKHDKIRSLSLEKGPDSIRVLGFTDKGRTLLKESTPKSRLPIYTNISRNVTPMVEANLSASRIHSLGYQSLKPQTRMPETQIPVKYLKEGY